MPLRGTLFVSLALPFLSKPSSVPTIRHLCPSPHFEICIFERHKGSFHLLLSTPKYPVSSRLGQVGARSPELLLGVPHGWQGPGYLDLPGVSARSRIRSGATVTRASTLVLVMLASSVSAKPAVLHAGPWTSIPPLTCSFFIFHFPFSTLPLSLDMCCVQLGNRSIKKNH